MPGRDVDLDLHLPPGVEEGTPVADSLSQSLAVDGPAAAQGGGGGDEAEPSAFESRTVGRSGDPSTSTRKVSPSMGPHICVGWPSPRLTVMRTYSRPKPREVSAQPENDPIAS